MDILPNIWCTVSPENIPHLGDNGTDTKAVFDLSNLDSDS